MICHTFGSADRMRQVFSMHAIERHLGAIFHRNFNDMPRRLPEVGSMVISPRKIITGVRPDLPMLNVGDRNSPPVKRRKGELDV